MTTPASESGPGGRGGEMAPAEFRRYGQEVVDLVARYLEGLDGIPPLPQVNPGEVLAALAPSPPEEG